jgi:hypothetical protein
MAATAVFVWVARSPGPADTRREAASTPNQRAGAAAPSTRGPGAIAEPSEPIIEFVDVPAARAFPAPPRIPSKGLAKLDHADGGAKAAPSGKVGSGAVPIPSPSGTAAFGSARD